MKIRYSKYKQPVIPELPPTRTYF